MAGQEYVNSVPQNLMKKIVLFIVLGLLAARASAVQLYEAFAYPPASSLAGQGGWVLTAGSSPTIQAGSLTTPGLMPACHRRTKPLIAILSGE